MEMKRSIREKSYSPGEAEYVRIHFITHRSIGMCVAEVRGNENKSKNEIQYFRKWKIKFVIATVVGKLSAWNGVRPSKHEIWVISDRR